MDFQYSEDNLQMQRTLRQFMDRHVLPQNQEWKRLADSGVYLWSWGRAMRYFDGPDEVHLRTLARVELAKARENLGSTAAYYSAN